MLNFFPGDHFTAEKYKAFVVHITKQHQGKDSKINIDDYFHIEDQREWTFFIGNPEFISPWWSKGFPRFLLSCVFLLGWPARMGYSGQIAKHQVEVKKAVFCENTSQDEGVSLSATPGSGSNETTTGQVPVASAAAVKAAEANGKAEEVKKEEEEAAVEDEADSAKATAATTDGEEASPAKMVTKATSPPPALREDPLGQNPHLPGSNPRQSQAAVQAQQGLNLELQGRRQNEHLVNAVISNPPPMATQMMQQQQHYSQHQRQQHNPHRQQQHYHQQQQQQLYQQQQQLFQQPLQQQQLYSAGALQAASRQAPPPLQPPQRQSRSHHPQQQQPHSSSTAADGKDVVTAVTHHQDVNGVNAVNTIALKDIDVQMSALSGYETYV